MQIFGSHRDRAKQFPVLSDVSPKKKRRALFLDRDGVLNSDTGFPYLPSQTKLVHGVETLLCWANLHGFTVIIITNQSGIGRGLFTESQFRDFMAWLVRELQSSCLAPQACYFSPQTPDCSQQLNSDVLKRKPNPEMFLCAITDFDIDPSKSVSVGDKHSDIDAARRAGISTNFLLSRNEPDWVALRDACELVSTHEILLSRLENLHNCDEFCQSTYQLLFSGGS